MKQKVLLLLENNEKKENTIHKRNPKNIKNIKLSSRISPLRFPGGKSKLIDFIYNDLPEHTEIFVEPFCGGASVGLSLLMSKVIKTLVINDLDIGVYSLFWTILNEPNYLIEKINKTIITKEQFKECKDNQKNEYDSMSTQEIAFNFLVINRCAFSGIYNASHLSDITCRYNPNDLIRRINLIHSMKEDIILSNDFAENIIEKYKNKENCYIFIDPPYYKKGKLLYKHFFQEEDHISLFNKINDVIHENSKADILITYDNSDFIEKLYSKNKNIDIKVINRSYSLIQYKKEEKEDEKL